MQLSKLVKIINRHDYRMSERGNAQQEFFSCSAGKSWQVIGF